MRLCAAGFTSSQRNPRYCESAAGGSILTNAAARHRSRGAIHCLEIGLSGYETRVKASRPAPFREGPAQLGLGATLSKIKTSGGRIVFRIRRKEERQWPLLSSAVSPPIVVGNDGKATAYVNSGLVRHSAWARPVQLGRIPHQDHEAHRNPGAAIRHRVLQSVQPPAVRQSPRNTLSAFGQITTTSTNPRLMQLALKYIF